MKRCKLSYCLLAVMMLLALLLPQGLMHHTSTAEARATIPLGQPIIGSTGHVGALTAETDAHYQTSIHRPGGIEASGPLCFTSHVITTSADYARSVYAADIDDDGDMDLLSASRDDATIAWYANDGTEHPTFASHVISTGAVGATSVYADDMDGDGDVDLLSAPAWDDKIAWYENNSVHKNGRALGHPRGLWPRQQPGDTHLSHHS
jgi:hypothetical protein